MRGMDPGLASLTGPGVAELLAGALDEELVAWRVRQVDHRPGSSTTVAYDATLRGPGGTVHQLLGASVRGGSAPEVWRFPLDPGLPALATATDEDEVRELLTSYGIPPGPVRLDVRTYRPRRRAVVEVRAPECRLFLKVVRPKAVEALHDRHRLLRDAGLPVPRSLGWSADGLLVLEALSGTPLRTRLREGGSPVPDGAELLALLDRLPPAVCALPARRSWTDGVEHYAGVLAAALPAEGARAADLAASVRDRTQGRPADEPSHGDFYESQLLLDGAHVRGVLDVDTVGPGRRADDLACLLAHVGVLAQMEPAHAATTEHVAAGWLADFSRRVDPGELRARVAGVVVSLATGPHRVQQSDWVGATRARLDLAEQWLEDPPVASGG